MHTLLSKHSNEMTRMYMPASSPLPLGASGQEEAGTVTWRVFLPMGLSMHPQTLLPVREEWSSEA